MRRLANGTQVASRTAVAASGTPGYANTAAPGAGVTPSILGPDDFNIIQEEIMSVVTAGAVTPDATGATVNQMLTALQNMFAAAPQATGVQILYGVASIATGNGDVVTLPNGGFANGILAVIASDGGNGAHSCGWASNSGSKTTFLAYGRNPAASGAFAATSYQYIAIGH
jgi:hypothetical protein